MRSEPPSPHLRRHHPPSPSPASAFDVPGGWGAAVSGEAVAVVQVATADVQFGLGLGLVAVAALLTLGLCAAFMDRVRLDWQFALALLITFGCLGGAVALMIASGV